MGCEHLEEYYELYLVGVICDGACADIHEHVESACGYCLEHLREAALSIYLLSLTAKPVRPDPKTKSQILKRLRKRWKFGGSGDVVRSSENRKGKAEGNRQ